MKNKNKLRDWATPITTGAFVLSAVTGIMLFFKLEFHLIKHMHEWLSWFLVIGTILHLIANGRASMRYLSKPTGKFILILFLLLTCASFLPIDVKHGEHPSKKISEAIINSKSFIGSGANRRSSAQWGNQYPEIERDSGSKSGTNNPGNRRPKSYLPAGDSGCDFLNREKIFWQHSSFALIEPKN